MTVSFLDVAHASKTPQKAEREHLVEAVEPGTYFTDPGHAPSNPLRVVYDIEPDGSISAAAPVTTPVIAAHRGIWLSSSIGIRRLEKPL